MKILAIDPGYDRLGVAVLEKKNHGKEDLVYSECFSPDQKQSPEKRTLLVGKKIKELITNYKPEVLVLESLFFNKNQKTALAVAETRGVIIYEAGLADIAVKQFTPLQIKPACTGYGRSNKQQVSTMIRSLINTEGKQIKFDDEYDAIAVGLTFFACHR